MDIKKQLFIFLLSLLLMACDQESVATQKVAGFSGAAVQRVNDHQQLALGESVYVQRCARCHGVNAEGGLNWRQRGPDGFFPPPPLNGSGHAWHHPAETLKQMILQGSQPGQGKMPAWQEKLSEQEVEAVIAWFQSLWPDQVYATWYEVQQRNSGLR